MIYFTGLFLMHEMNPKELAKLSQQLEGSLHTDDLTRTIYATDASVYRKIPLAVAYPKNALDIQKIIRFASKYHVPIIPRTAGTSLAGQVVGEGIIVDVSKHLNNIIEIDAENKTVVVEPGVVRDELNYHLKEFGLFFAPNTSTTNRCMIGGMVGNNSSGTTSIRYGVTRDKILELDCLLADGSEVSFKNLNPIEFQQKTKLKTLEGKLYQSIFKALSSDAVQNQIKTHFPKPEIHRRNTGYAVDALLENAVFGDSEEPFNFSKLMAGSEGTLAFTTKIKLQLDDLPPANNIMVVSHFDSIEKSMNAVLVAMKHRLYSCEMLDKVILDCTKNNPVQLKNRFFISGDPKAIMMFEVASHAPEDAEIQAENLLSDIKRSGFSYADVTLKGNEINQAIELRKAGLGLLGNMIGDRKAVACIEDTAVSLKDLPAYIKEFSELMERFGQDAVYYAHAGAGELHLRPILDLKKSGDVRLFREITQAVADLVQKYKGSMSGEHGDGIVRAEFIPQMVGKANYELFQRIKNTFDPEGIFNPGKIVNAWPMDESLRFEKDAVTPEIETLLDFSDSQGILRAAEKCNGAGDCRKLPESGGTMCPSYRATRLEKDTTRARANTLREILTHNTKVNRFDSEQLKEVFDLCLSCKGCVGECPSNVDAASLKAEFLYQYQKSNGVPLRSKIFAYNNSLNRLGGKFSSVTNFLFTNKLTAGVIKAMTGVAKKRT
ncbi:MAG: FAD-linked oxidase C-terminal domain-containing protein, partial [Flavobacteriaceae bacterium]|nr:FAD-linked oxidase C-terminal domain-containing protein [Flavobacteriaceae bacterium]